LAKLNPLSEANVKNAIQTYLQLGVNQGKWEFIRIQSGNIFLKGGNKTYKIQLAETGYPDFVVFKSRLSKIRKSLVYFLEVKSTKGQITEEQIKMHKRLQAQGCYADVVRSVDEVMEILH